MFNLEVRRGSERQIGTPSHKCWPEPRLGLGRNLPAGS